MVNVYGLNYCADHSNGNIYEYSLDIVTDNGDSIIKQRDTAVIHGGLFGTPGKRLHFHSVTFNIVSGYAGVEGTGGQIDPVDFDVELAGVVTFDVDLGSNVSFNTG